jgi:hypothetical protein
MAAKGKSKDSFAWIGNLKDILFSTKGLPFFLTFTTLAVLFVLIRMKNVEKDYQIAKTNKDIEKVLLDNKELKAKKARMLSSDKLRKLASIHHLEQPKQDQIIVIP